MYYLIKFMRILVAALDKVSTAIMYQAYALQKIVHDYVDYMELVATERRIYEVKKAEDAVKKLETKQSLELAAAKLRSTVTIINIDNKTDAKLDKLKGLK